MEHARAGRREETPGAGFDGGTAGPEGRRAGYQMVELPDTVTDGRGAGLTTGYANW